MDAAQLTAALEPYRSVPGLHEALAALLGGAPVDLVPPAYLHAAHLVQQKEFLAVYLFTRTHFGLLEATRAGARFSVAVPARRIRRVALLEGLDFSQLTIELDADQSITTVTPGQEGTFTAGTKAAGYEITSANAAERVSLRQCAAAYIANLQP